MTILALLGLASLFVGWKQRRKDPALLAYAISAVIFGLLMVKSLRFVEYFVPFTVAAMAVNSGTLGKRLLAPVLLGLSILYMLAFGTEPWKILASKTAYIEPVIAQHFNRLIPPGAQIFTPGWDYTGNLMLALPERRFIVAADPTLLYKRDPELYNSWRRIPLEAPPDSAEGIRRLFRARYVISLNFEAYWPFFDALSADAKVRSIFSNGKWVVFDLGEPSIN